MVCIASSHALTEDVEKGVGEEVAVNVAGVALQNVDVIAGHVRVFDVVDADLTTCAILPLCVQSSHQQLHLFKKRAKFGKL